MSRVPNSEHSADPNGSSPKLDYASPGAVRVRELSPEQWKSGLAAWLGWLFDGLDMHLYTIVAAPFVADLLNVAVSDPLVKSRSSWIQAAFLVGWALGGGAFGRVGDRLGRSRALGLTILTYAAFTGLSFFAQTWWQLMIFRFMAALGIGGEWAVGSSLLAETWPSRWRPLAAACLQTAVNIGVLIACGVTYVLAGHQRFVFLVGILPALIVFWIRRSVPETTEWIAARRADVMVGQAFLPAVEVMSGGHSCPPESTRIRSAGQECPALADSGRQEGPPHQPYLTDLFRGSQGLLTARTVVVCACSLTAWWAFMFWINQHIRNLPDLANRSTSAREHFVSLAFFLIIGASIAGNFFASLLAWAFGYRRGIAMMFLGFFIAMAGAFAVPRGHASLMLWVPWVGFFSGVFGLFTMYLPPLFPTLLRTTGAGFSYNIGRLAAAAGTVGFGLFAHFGDFRLPLFYNSLLFIPAMVVALTLPEGE